MKFRIKYRDPIFPWNRRLRGIVLWPFVFMRPYEFETSDLEHKEKLEKEYNERLYRHELEHCYQVKRQGIFSFYFNYVRVIMKTGYKNHPIEIEANDRENDPLTPLERKWYNNGIIDLSEMED